MATITDLQIQQGEDPILPVDVSNSPQVEPLGGPLSVDNIIASHFPEQVYDQSRDTHIYKLLTALCGDAGAGILKKQAYAARLITEAQGITFQELDTFYVQNFQFERLKSEQYPTNPTTGLPLDPVTEILTSGQWDTIENNDNAFRHRFQDFMNATRIGNSPSGINLAARSATGIEVETIENYKAIYDTFSDDIQNRVIQGTTFSPNEFILTPRVVNASGAPNTAVSYQATLGKQFAPVSQTNIAPTWVTTTQTYLSPDIERNMIRIMDRVRPVNSLMTVTNTNIHFKTVPVTSTAASSDHIKVTRFVTGKPAVSWPTVNNTKGFFIQPNIETEATSQALTAIDQPNIYPTIESIYSYTDLALLDPTYNTSAFFTGFVSPFKKYVSEHSGLFFKVISQIFTFLQLAPTTVVFDAEEALASTSAVPNLVGKADNNGGL